MNRYNKRDNASSKLIDVNANSYKHHVSLLVSGAYNKLWDGTIVCVPIHTSISFATGYTTCTIIFATTFTFDLPSNVATKFTSDRTPTFTFDLPSNVATKFTSDRTTTLFTFDLPSSVATKFTSDRTTTLFTFDLPSSVATKFTSDRTTTLFTFNLLSNVATKFPSDRTTTLIVPTRAFQFVVPSVVTFSVAAALELPTHLSTPLVAESPPPPVLIITPSTPISPPELFCQTFPSITQQFTTRKRRL